MAIQPNVLRRVAILVSTLDTTSADRLLDQMTPEDAAEVRRVIVELTDVDLAEEHDVISEFLFTGTAVADPAASAAMADGVDLCLSESFTAIDEPTIHEAAPTPLCEQGLREPGSLDDVACEPLANVLASERPQIIALVMSRLSEPRALEVLTTLPDELQCQVLQRWMTLDVADSSLAREIEEELRARIDRQRDDGRRGASFAQIASVVQAAKPVVQRKLLASLARFDATAATAISAPHLAFDDLEYLSDAGLAELLRASAPRTLVLALAGASESFADRIARQLPPPAAKELARSINSLGPTRLVDVEAAQRDLAKIAEKLLQERDVIASPLPLSVAG